MEQALFQKGAFGVSETENDFNKVDPAEVEKLLKYGAYAFLDEEQGEGSENAANTAVKIEDILKNKGEKKGVQKTSFNVQGDSGKASTKKGGSGLKINDPNFWEKVLPFDGFNPKQLLRKFKQKRNDLASTHESQKKFLKDIQKCTDDLVAAKQVDPSFVIDEDIYELLKKVSKCKDFATKYKDKAQAHLDMLLNSESLIISDQQRFARKAKQETDYSETKEKKGEKKKAMEEDIESDL